MDELAAFGLEGLSIPRIAMRTEVNKTSIYRRWATREALIEAALQAALEEHGEPVGDRGSLRADVEAIVRMLAQRIATPAGRALARVALSDAAAEHFVPLSGATLQQELADGAAVVLRAVERGEWDVARHPPEAVFAMISGSLIHRVMLERQPVTDAWIRTVVDVVVAGLAAASVPHAAGPAGGGDVDARARALHGVVNLKDRVVEVYTEPKGGQYIAMRIVRPGESLRPTAVPLLATLESPVDSILPRPRKG